MWAPSCRDGRAAQVGASKKLGIVIEGESLLNDGTAFVLFLVFLVRRALLMMPMAAAPHPLPCPISSLPPTCAACKHSSCMLPQEMVQGHELGAADIVVKFIRLAAGGPAVGIVFGMAATWWLSRIFNDGEPPTRRWPQTKRGVAPFRSDLD